MIKKLTIFICFIILSSNIYSNTVELTKKEISNLRKQKVSEHILYETYFETNRGVASVLGFHFDSFINENIYYSTAIFGAVSGICAGYGLALVGGGYSHSLNENLNLDTRFLIGSGGGGGLKGGGGFAIEAMSGFSYKVAPKLLIEAKLGYLYFPTGSFKSPVINIGVAYQNFKLFLP